MFLSALHSPDMARSSLALVLEPVTVAGDLHDVRMVQQPIQHRRRQRLTVGEGPAHWVNGRLLVRIMLPRS